jgi:UDP-N-acetylmuramate: L-alanyl-gamma-D-glutamyl-meso-diaminopimelate ligase
MHVHIVAVAGTAMGSLAGLLVELGHEVSGSDVAFDPPMGPALEAWGVRCLQGFDARHLEPEPDLVVVGNVCRRDNVEAKAAIERGLEFTHVAGALRRFALEGTSPLVVAGTHGKTTTTSIAAWLLEATGYEPGFLVGGIPKNFERSFRTAREPRRRLETVGGPRRQKPFVLEGDEYDTAFFEKTPKFIHYGAEVAIITSIEHDHIDIYPELEQYLDAFRRFISGVPEHGLIVANAADALVVELVNDAARAEVAWYALEDEDTHGMAPHWLAAPAGSNERATSFDLFAGGVACGRLSMPLPGRHNVGNATAAIGALAQGYGVRLDELGPALARFAGVKRRQDLLGEPRGIFVYDDFAHHPTAVRETLLALRMRHPKARLFAVFEPRSATACRNLHQAEYARSFDSADDILIAPLGRSGLPPEERLDVDQLVAELEARGRAAGSAPSVDAIVQRLVGEARPGDVIALLSNGAFGGIHARLLDALAS